MFEDEILRGSASRRIREYEMPTLSPGSQYDRCPDFGVELDGRARPVVLDWSHSSAAAEVA